MYGHIYLSAVSCLLLHFIQIAHSQAVAETTAAAAAPAVAAAPVTDGFCPNMTLRALRINCETMDGAVAKTVPCSQAPVGASAKVTWRKNALKNLNSGLEIECEAPGVWKIKMKKIESKADFTVVAGVGAYKVHKEKKSWSDAEVVCIKDGGHVVVVDTEDELREVKTLMATIGKVDGNMNAMHYGISDRNVEGTFETVLGAPFKAPTFLPWAKGEPSGRAEDCGAMNIASYDVADVGCSQKLPFICELFQS